MNHEDVLKLLFPVEIGGVCGDDFALEGRRLDLAQTSAEGLLREMFPDKADALIPDFERVYALIPATGATLQERRSAVIRKIRERGGLSREYFIGLAALHGHDITIDELKPFMAGWGSAGDRVYVQGVLWIWQVNAPAAAGTLAALFESLKPAHTAVFFNYI